jgi:excisionase family DNA binding protein
LFHLCEVTGIGCHRRILGTQAALCSERSAGATIMVPTDLSSPLALRPREAAKALGISARHLWQLTKEGHIPCVRVGSGTRKTVLYPVADLQAWLTRQTQAKGGEQ